MKIIVVTLAFTASFVLMGQGNTNIRLNTALENFAGDDTQIINENTAKYKTNSKLVGTPYLNDDFEAGSVFIKGVKKGDYFLRYNIYAEAFEVQTITAKENEFNLIHKNSDIEIEMGGKRYIYKFYLVDGVQQFGYFEVIKDSKNAKLLKKYRKLIQEGKAAVTSFDVARPSRLVDKEGYFILIGDKKVVEVKQNRKQLAKSFEEFNVNLTDYLREQKLNLKEDKDLIAAFDFIDKSLDNPK